MAYQRCPVCNGSGEIYQINDLSTTAVNKFPATCKTCAGTGIINEITGLPPSYSEPKSKISPTNIPNPNS